MGGEGKNWREKRFAMLGLPEHLIVVIVAMLIAVKFHIGGQVAEMMWITL